MLWIRTSGSDGHSGIVPVSNDDAGDIISADGMAAKMERSDIRADDICFVPGIFAEIFTCTGAGNMDSGSGSQPDFTTYDIDYGGNWKC